jgi:hypothetical protein
MTLRRGRGDDSAHRTQAFVGEVEMHMPFPLRFAFQSVTHRRRLAVSVRVAWEKLG